MASTLVALQTVTVGAGGAANISFTNIPQTYTDLVVKWSARAAGAYGPIETEVTFNGDISAGVFLYSQRNLSGYNSGAYSASTTNSYRFNLQYATGSSATANTFSNNEIYIPNYTSTTEFKSVSFESVSENNATTEYILGPAAGLWAKTDAIKSIVIQSNGVGNWVQYSTFTLYGVYKDAAETTPAAPTIGTATAGSQAADVAFTPAGSGAPASSYVVTSSPGGLTATGASSPIQINGLTSGTAYTFTVRGQNPGGLGAASAASNSVTPYDGYESIATLYPTGATAEFTSIPSTYTHLQIRYIGRNSVNNSVILIRLNSDTGSNYSLHYLYGNGASVASGGAASQTNMEANMAVSTYSANVFGSGVIDLLDYANTNKYKTLRVLNGFDNNGSGQVTFSSGSWRNTNAVTSITLIPNSSGNFVSGTVFELYGIRG